MCPLYELQAAALAKGVECNHSLRRKAQVFVPSKFSRELTNEAASLVCTRMWHRLNRTVLRTELPPPPFNPHTPHRETQNRFRRLLHLDKPVKGGQYLCSHCKCRVSDRSIMCFTRDQRNVNLGYSERSLDDQGPVLSSLGGLCHEDCVVSRSICT